MQSRAPRQACFIIALATGLASSIARADADGPDFFVVRGVRHDDVLNIRAAPSPRARKVGEIPPEADCVRNLGCRGGLTLREFTELSPAARAERERQHPRWCKVEYRSVTGWVAGRYLAEGGCGAPADGPGLDDAEASASRRAGAGDFDATGKIACTQRTSQPRQQCDFGVARAGSGSATLVVTRPDGMTRALFFIKGTFLSADTAQADGHPEYGAEKRGDLHLIHVGEERYEIPDAVIFGG